MAASRTSGPAIRADEATDEALMACVRQGDAGLLAELFERHHRQVYAYLYRMSRDRALSEDLTQDVFLRILRYRESYQPKTSFAAWMYGIARNALVDSIRKRRPEAPWDGDAALAASSEERADERLRAEQEKELLARALASLPADKREIIVLSRYQELRYDEIGRILGCEPNAVKQRVFRAVKTLGERFVQLSGRAAR